MCSAIASLHTFHSGEWWAPPLYRVKCNCGANTILNKVGTYLRPKIGTPHKWLLRHPRLSTAIIFQQLRSTSVEKLESIEMPRTIVPPSPTVPFSSNGRMSSIEFQMALPLQIGASRTRWPRASIVGRWSVTCHCASVPLLCHRPGYASLGTKRASYIKLSGQL
jgi:hypothetical protein